MKMPVFITAAILICTVKVQAQVGTGDKPMISNVSHTEYETKMKMFLDTIKGTVQDTIHTVILPQGIDNQGTGNEVIKFNSNAIPGADGHTLRLFVTGAPQVTIYQIDSYGKEIEIGTESLEMGPRWVGVHLGKHPSEELTLRVSCGNGCQVLDAKLNTFSKALSGERAFFTESHKCDSNKSDAKTQCCLKNTDINLREMQITSNLEGPVWINFGYCIGGCPFNFNYATEHARLRHLVERTYNLTSGQDPCLPTKYGSIKVLQVNEYDSLVIKTWDNFFAKSCACF